MLAGTVVSAVIGGLAGLMFALGQGLGLVHALFAYQAGGMIAVLGLVALAQQTSFGRL